MPIWRCFLTTLSLIAFGLSAGCAGSGKHELAAQTSGGSPISVQIQPIAATVESDSTSERQTDVSAKPSDLSALTTNQRSAAQNAALAAFQKVVGLDTSSRLAVSKALGTPTVLGNGTEAYLNRRMIDAFVNPEIVQRIIQNLTDHQLEDIRQNPDSIIQILATSAGSSWSAGFDRLNAAQLRDMTKIFGEIYETATPDECQTLLQGKFGQLGPFSTFMKELDRLPESSSHGFVELLVASMQQPIQPTQPPLSLMETEIVKLTMLHYLSYQTDEIRSRWKGAFNASTPPLERCWGLGQMVTALMSGDDELSQLGARLMMRSQ